MVAHIKTLAFEGLKTLAVDVQVHLASGIPAFNVVGLPDKAIAESRERVRSALSSIGLSLPSKRITVNLAPADLTKEGSHYDLAIIVGLLIAMDILPQDALEDYYALGEISLDGSVLPVSGILPAAMHALEDGKGILCPEYNGSEAAWSGNSSILAPASILALINHIKGLQVLSPPSTPITQPVEASQYNKDLKDIKGQAHAKRALEIAASGGHNLLMLGPPGSGKSMLAACLPSILPPLSTKEMLECSMIQSITKNLERGELTQVRPFRDPHHSCSMPAMIGGGKQVKPGEVTLAHHGILFLDELPEFPTNVLESLRQPLETKQVTLARVNSHVTYPANFQLIAAMNPCRCGYLGDPMRTCPKAPKCGSDYQSKISGPFLDRIDLHIEVPAITPAAIHDNASYETSEDVRKRVAQVRNTQELRYEGYHVTTNAQADGDLLIEVAFPDDSGKTMLNQAVEKFGLSMRGYYRVLRVARTIADMEGAARVKQPHIAEALSYRQLDNLYRPKHQMMV